MIVVADTSPLNYLILLGQEDILRELYGRVAIPHDVHSEMMAPRAPAMVMSWAARLPAWIDVISVLRVDETLPEGLGDGERQAISLALQMGADAVLLDDLLARSAAQERGLQATGCLAVLLEASKLNLLDFELSLAQLKALSFRMSKGLEATFVELARNAKR